jgi:hypothetical protein
MPPLPGRRDFQKSATATAAAILAAQARWSANGTSDSKTHTIPEALLKPAKLR